VSNLKKGRTAIADEVHGEGTVKESNETKGEEDNLETKGKDGRPGQIIIT